MLAGLFAGAAIAAVPHPRLMLAPDTAGFTASGLLPMAAALLPSSSLRKLPGRAAGLIIRGYVGVAAAEPFGNRRGLLGNQPGRPVAGAEAGVSGGGRW